MAADADFVGEEELSGTTLAVLAAIGGFFALAALYVLFALARGLRGKPRPSTNEHEPQPASGGKAQRPKRAAREPAARPPSPEPQAPSEPAKPGVSLKTLMKQSNRAASTHAAKDVPVDHPLYIGLLKGFQDVVAGAAFSPDGAFVAVACEDRMVRVFSVDDAGARTFGFNFKALGREPIDVAFGSPHDLFVLTKGGVDSAVLEKYDFSPGAKGDAIRLAWEAKGLLGKEPGKGLRGAATPQGHGLALSFSTEASVCAHSASGAQLAAVSSGGLKNHGAALSQDGRLFGAATFTSDVRLWELQFARTGEFRAAQKVMDLKKAHDSQVYALAFSPDSRKAVTASKDGSWAVWNIDVRYQQDEDPKVLLRRPQETGPERYRLLAFGPGGLVAAAYGSTLHFLDSASGNLLEDVEGAHEGEITHLEWSPAPLKHGGARSQVLLTAGRDRRVRLWRAPIV